MRISTITLLSCLPALSYAFTVPRSSHNVFLSSSSTLQMAIDYTDPIVAAEYASVQSFTLEEVEEELIKSGIRVPPTMNDMEAKLMLVEMRLLNSGKIGEGKEEKRPDKFSSAFEEAMWTKPAFKAFYNIIKDKGDLNSMNVVAEYLNTKDIAIQRYGKDYASLMAQIDGAMKAPTPVNSKTIQFSGFPANMGEAGCKMTLEAVGEIADFACTASEDSPILTGTVTFTDLESAKAAVKQYDGMDMGMGTILEFKSA